MTAPVADRNPAGSSLWRRAQRFTFVRSRLTRRRLDRFMAAHATAARVLVVHSPDIDHRRHFPNGVHVSSRADRAGQIGADAHYRVLADMAPGEYDLVVCTGLLEHVPDPDRLIADLAGRLRPGGRLIVSASAVFSFHGAPENYFHFTPNGLQRLFGAGLEMIEMRGSTGPFETLAVLSQRISLQCDVFPPVRPLLDAMTLLLPLFDRAILRQYNNLARIEPADDAIGIMPATLVVIARKSQETGQC